MRTYRAIAEEDAIRVELQGLLCRVVCRYNSHLAAKVVGNNLRQKVHIMMICDMFCRWSLPTTVRANKTDSVFLCKLCKLLCVPSAQQ